MISKQEISSIAKEQIQGILDAAIVHSELAIFDNEQFESENESVIEKIRILEVLKKKVENDEI